MIIDRNSSIPMYKQIYDSIVSEIVDGYLIPGEKLPSRRAMCEKLGVSPQTVESAYSRLVSDGYITGKAGSGYYVSTERVWDEEEKQMKNRIYNFSSNGVETSKLPFADWSKLMRNTIKENTALFQHGEKAGEWCLRKSIRRLLFRTQGIRCRTEQIIIGPGAEDILRTIFTVFARDSRVLMNNYYNYRVNNAALVTNSKIAYLQDDHTGINIDELNKYSSGVLYQMPTHALPTGVTLSEAKRKAITDWLGDGRYVIEDSSQNDFVFGKKKKTLWEMNGGKNVIHVGSFSQTIAPSMKIGYALMPDDLIKKWFDTLIYYSNRVSRVEQVTLSKFIDLGYYERHVEYMKNIYKEKTKALKDAIKQSPLNNVTELSGDDAGFYVMAHFNLKCSQDKAERLLTKTEVKMSPLDSSLGAKKTAVLKPNTFVMGYGNMTISAIKEGVERIYRAWKDYI